MFFSLNIVTFEICSGSTDRHGVQVQSILVIDISSSVFLFFGNAANQTYPRMLSETALIKLQLTVIYNYRICKIES